MMAERKEQGLTRRNIMQLLRRHGELTALELSDHLGVGAVGIRQHLGLLERDELIQIVGLRRGVGRPANLYALTEAAKVWFPSHYDHLALNLVDQVEIIGGAEALTTLLSHCRAQQVRELAPALTGKSRRERVATLAEKLVEQGYMCEWEEASDGSLLLTEYNCPLDCVARRHQQFCVQEQLLYIELLETPVIQESTIAQGSLCCRYRIPPAEADLNSGGTNDGL